MKVAVDKKWNIKYEYNEMDRRIYRVILCYNSITNKLEKKRFEYAFDNKRFNVVQVKTKV